MNDDSISEQVESIDAELASLSSGDSILSVSVSNSEGVDAVPDVHRAEIAPVEAQAMQ